LRGDVELEIAVQIRDHEVDRLRADGGGRLLRERPAALVEEHTDGVVSVVGDDEIGRAVSVHVAGNDAEWILADGVVDARSEGETERSGATPRAAASSGCARRCDR
jgi:hypothetical protein